MANKVVIDTELNAQGVTRGAEEIQKDIDKVIKKQEALEAKMEKFGATGGKEDSRAYKGMLYDAQKLDEEMAKLEAEMNAVSKIDMGLQENQLSGASNEMEAVSESSKRAGSFISSLGKKIRSTASSFAGVLTSAVKKAGNAIKNFGKHSNQANASLASGLKTILKYGFGIRSLFVLINKFRGALVDGMKNLAQWNDGNNSVNKSLSNLKSGLTQMKNSLATAFAPILTVVEPILTKFISIINKVITTIGMFFASLTGQKTFVVAKEVQEDYAKSLDKTAKKAKKAKTYLSGLDEIRQFTSKDEEDSDSSSGTSPKNMFEEIKLDDKFAKIKDLIDKILEPIKKAWAKYGEPLIKSAKYALGEIKKLVLSIGKSFLEVWTNGTGEEIVGHILVILTNMLTTIGNIARQFRKAWELDGIGTQIVQDMADILNVVLAIIEDLTGATAKWSETLDFSPMLKAFDGLLKSVKPLVELLGGAFARVYKDVLLPFASWTLEKLNPEIINILANAFKLLGSVINAIKPSVEYFWKKVILPMGEFAGKVFLQFLDSVKKLFADVADVINKRGSAINTVLTVLAKTFELLFKGVIAPMIQFGMGVLSTFFSYFDNLVDDFFDVLDGIIKFISGVFSLDFKKAWDGIKEIAKGVVNALIDIVEACVNELINGINSVSFDVPDWIPKIGGQQFGFNLPTINIPRLATGTVIPRQASEFLAVLGDNNAESEVVSPLSTIKQAVAEVMGSGYGNRVINLTGVIDRRVLFEEMIEEARVQSTIMGSNLNFMGV